MNKIVREHYPAARLPEDLRAAFGTNARVTVTVEEEAQVRPPTEENVGWFERHKHIRRNYYRTTEEIVEHVRDLREERSHVER